MTKHDSVYLQHLLDAIDTISGYLDNVDEATFKGTRLLRDGVIRQIQIIGEADRRVSPELRAGHPDVPWQDIAGMRSRLVHDCVGVDSDTVWLTATEDLPPLEAKVGRFSKPCDPLVTGLSYSPLEPPRSPGTRLARASRALSALGRLAPPLLNGPLGIRSEPWRCLV